MIRFLDGLCLLKEVDTIEGVMYNSSQLRRLFPEKIVVIRHASYIYRDCLCDVARARVTNLDDYVNMGDLSERVSIRNEIFSSRIRSMKKNENIKFFDFLEVCNIYFIKIEKEVKSMFENYQPFYAKLEELDNLSGLTTLGDIKIGFY